jgi:Ca2+-binding EF-hand superfamily protein
LNEHHPKQEMLEMKRSLIAVAAAVALTALSVGAQQTTPPAQSAPGTGPFMGPRHGPMGPMGGGAHGPMRGGWMQGQGFAQLDTDKDGKISRDEMGAQFDRLDTNKDGFLSREELIAARAQFGARHGGLDADADGFVSREEARNAPRLSQDFDAVDSNKDGRLSRDELHAHRVAKGGDGLARLDTNKDGSISRDEAKTAPRLSANFDALDSNKDGLLSHDELRSVWAGRRHHHGPRMDTNGDGLISRDEAKGAPMLSQQFDAIDANKDGSLSRDELYAWRRTQVPAATAPVKP